MRTGLLVYVAIPYVSFTLYLRVDKDNYGM